MSIRASTEDPAHALQTAIIDLESAEASFRGMRESFRRIFRLYLAARLQQGDGVTLGKKLNVSVAAISNLKIGYSIPSIALAKQIMKELGDE